MLLDPKKLHKLQFWMKTRYPIVATCSLFTVIVLLVVFWVVTRTPLPPTITIASGHTQGLYHELATHLKAPLERNSGVEVIVKDTMGSYENQVLLQTGKANLAIIQAGAVDMKDIAALVPLYPDVVIPIVRRDSAINSIEEMNGRKILIGPNFSGMRKSATNVLDHYGLKIIDSEAPFERLLSDDSVEGAIVTTGLFNDNLREILATGDFKLLDIPHASALSHQYAYFTPYLIPTGLFSESPVIPSKPLMTVSTTSFLAVHKDVPENLVNLTLDTLYTTDLTMEIPNLISREEASTWNIFPMHPASRHYFQPYEGIDVLANLLSSMEAIKELLIAAGASLFLVWRVRKYYRDMMKEQELTYQKSKLETLFNETLLIERKHVSEDDPDKLELLLDGVTNIKLRAFESLMGHDIVDHPSLTLFLIQCDNLSTKIRLKQDTELEKIRLQ